MATVEARRSLRGTDGYVVETPEGHVGWVEEVWLGDTNEPRAVAVRTTDGRHGLLLKEQVLAVDREYHWVVVPPEPTLLELDVPRLVEGDGRSRPSASWTTTGKRFPVSVPRPRPFPAFRLGRSGVARREWPLWRSVATLLGTIALLVVFTITLAYVMAWLVTGAPY
jgi:hypothetical protein